MTSPLVSLLRERLKFDKGLAYEAYVNENWLPNQTIGPQDIWHAGARREVLRRAPLDEALIACVQTLFDVQVENCANGCAVHEILPTSHTAECTTMRCTLSNLRKVLTPGGE